jgi:MtrB/PioB family decaheme-associated outer membrane protein
LSKSAARTGLALLALSALAGGRALAAEAAGSGLDDPGLEASREVDERGLSLLTPVRRRSPGGWLYPYPYAPPKWTTLGALDWRGFAELGYLGNADRDRETRFEEHVDWSDGLLLRDFFLDARSTGGGGYAEFQGGSAGRDDAFYRAELGRRGWLRLGLFYDEVPHVLANDARSLYLGLGSESLTLPAPLVPGGSSLAAIDAALLGAGERQLEIERDRAGASLSLRATPELSLTGHYRRERRTGERPFGGSIFFSFPFGGSNGSVIETVEPIDSLTHTWGAGLQYAGERVQANLAYRSSSFENQLDSLTWESPFSLLGPQVARGRSALAPDNQSYGVHGDLGVTLPMQGRWTASAAWNRMRQTEGLFPVTINPNFPDWDDSASLSDDEADALVETWLFDSSLRLRPLRALTARLHLRWFERNDHTDYVSYNPLLDVYGYVAEDGRFFSERTAPVPFDHSRLLGEASLLWRAPFGTNFELEYAHEETERSHRVRDTREEIGRASLTSRRLGPATLRLAYEIRDRRGDSYDTAHDAAYYAPGPAPVILPGFRQLDLASRFQHELQARLNLGLGSAVDVSLAGMLRNADFDSDYGRDFERGRELNLELGWQPSPKLELHAFGSVEKRVSRLNSSDEDGLGSFTPTNEWSADSDGSTLGFGTGFRAQVLPRLELSGDYSWLRSRDELDYRFASDGALAAATTAAEAGSGLPRLRTSDQVLRLAADLELDERWSARFFYRFEHSRLEDPQQRGLVPRPVSTQTLYLGHVDDDFKASVVGASLSLRF